MLSCNSGLSTSTFAMRWFPYKRVLAIAFTSLLMVSTAWAEVDVPSNVNFPRIQLLEKNDATNVNSKLKIYVVVKSAGILQKTLVQSTSLLNRYSVDLFKSELTSRIKATERFEVFADDVTDVQDQSAIVVEAQILDATQVIENMMVARKALSRVKLNLQIKDIATGRLERAQVFEGNFGMRGGEGTVFYTEQELASPLVQEALYNDMSQALTDAVSDAAYYLESKYRPVGRVIEMAGKQLAMIGGVLHGFKPGDEVVVFRTRFQRQNGVLVPGLMHGLAKAKCASVNDQTATCRLATDAASLGIQVGDYVIMDDSGLLQVQR